MAAPRRLQIPDALTPRRSCRTFMRELAERMGNYAMLFVPLL